MHAATRSGWPRWPTATTCRQRYTDYRELLDDPSIDVVGITTHVYDHRDIAIDALAERQARLSGKADGPDRGRLRPDPRGGREAAGFFMVGHICRFDPRVAMAKQAIDEGRIGKIVSMHARRNLSKAIGRMVLDDISALMGDGIHDADLMLWFSRARPVSVYAQEIHPGDNKYPDGGWAMARFDNGAVAVIESIWHLPESTPYQIDARMEVIGTEGALYINCGEAGLEIHDAAGNHLPDTIYWPKVFGQRFGILRAELHYFADCVAEGRRPERITPEESRDAVALMAAAANRRKRASRTF